MRPSKPKFHIKGQTTFPFTPHAVEEDTGWINLACGIVREAVDEWRKLVIEEQTEEVSQSSYDELRNFFRSSWCDLLLTSSSVNGRAILDRLERERKSVIHDA